MKTLFVLAGLGMALSVWATRAKTPMSGEANPFSGIPPTSDHESQLRAFQKKFGAKSLPNCLRGKPDRWIDGRHPDVANVIFHPISSVSAVEMAQLRNGDEFEIVNFGCESLQVGIRYLFPLDSHALGDIRHWYVAAAQELATIRQVMDRQKGIPFDLGLDSLALEKTSQEPKKSLALGEEIAVEGDGVDYQQARMMVLNVERISDQKVAVIVLLNRGPL